MRRRLKKKALIAMIGILLLIVLTIFGIQYYKKINSTSYKLEKMGYSKEETTLLLKQDSDKIEDILKMEYNKNIPTLLEESYFLYENLDRYLAYLKANEKISVQEAVTMVNVNRDRDFYKDPQKTDISKENAMLVNKYYALDKSFVFEDLTDVSIQHCYGSQKIRKEAYDQFKKMFNAAKKDDLTIIINSSYRTYDYQENLWNTYSNQHGDEWADSYAARAGHSEHQTGLAIDVTTYGVKEQGDFETTDEFKWMQENAYKYGFILRYPKDKENITGYAYESWHYRYVGTEIAKEIHELDITFDEYYAYYLK